MIHLVLGGARSGKSRFAESLAVKQNIPVCYVATATAGDEEMRERISHHQKNRPQNWQLIEEPFHLSQVLIENNISNSVLIIECITLWLSNWLCTNDTEAWKIEKQAFFDALLNLNCSVIIVSNEVGSGVIPMGELSREFVDQAGWINQSLAKKADKVSLVVAGCAIALKNMDKGNDKYAN